MFRIYQHSKKPDYRLIIPAGSTLPSEAKEENWNVAKTVEKVSLEAREKHQKPRISSVQVCRNFQGNRGHKTACESQEKETAMSLPLRSAMVIRVDSHREARRIITPVHKLKASAEKLHENR